MVPSKDVIAFISVVQLIRVVSASTVVIDIAPSSKWVHCIEDGRQDISWHVKSNKQIQSGLQLPTSEQKCRASKLSTCKWLATCDTSTECDTSYPGELSGRPKCLVVINPSEQDTATATIQLDLEQVGNWTAIICGVAMTTLGLLVVVAAGCYSDLRNLAAGDKRRHRPAAIRTKPARGEGHVSQLQTQPNGMSAALIGHIDGSRRK